MERCDMSLSYRIKRARVARYTPLQATIIATCIAGSICIAGLALGLAMQPAHITVLTYDAYMRAA